MSLLFIVFQIIFVSSVNTGRLDSIPIGIETILIIFYIITLLFELVNNVKTPITKHYCFWISVGILIYLGGSLFFYLIIDSLKLKEIATYGKMTYISEIIKNVLFGLSLIVYSKAGFKKEIQQEIRPAPFLDIT